MIDVLFVFSDGSEQSYTYTSEYTQIGAFPLCEPGCDCPEACLVAVEIISYRP